MKTEIKVIIETDNEIMQSFIVERFKQYCKNNYIEIGEVTIFNNNGAKDDKQKSHCG